MAAIGADADAAAGADAAAAGADADPDAGRDDQAEADAALRLRQRLSDRLLERLSAMENGCLELVGAAPVVGLQQGQG